MQDRPSRIAAGLFGGPHFAAQQSELALTWPIARNVWRFAQGLARRGFLFSLLAAPVWALAADPQITSFVDTPDPVPAGGVYDYAIHIDNNAADAATNVQLTLSVPAGATFVSATNNGMPSGPVVLFPHVFRKLSYDPVKDLSPISQLASFQFCVVSGPRTNVKSMAEMIAKAKADPGSATYGSSGNGTVPHFLGLMISDAAGIDFQHIPYQGAAPAVQALLGGHIG